MNFLKLKPGSNVVRILTKPYLYTDYYQGKPYDRYVIGVISRQDNIYYNLKLGKALIKQIGELFSDFGEPSNYDVDITYSPPKNLYDLCYKVRKLQDKPLSDEDKFIITNNPINILKSFSTPKLTEENNNHV